jgi:hypothetical protein
MHDVEHMTTSPAPKKISVCIHCGTILGAEQELEVRGCHHNMVADFDSIPPALSNLLVKIRAARAFLEGATKVLVDTARAEMASGRAELSMANDFQFINVTHLPMKKPASEVRWAGPLPEMAPVPVAPPEPLPAPAPPRPMGPRLVLTAPAAPAAKRRIR